MIKLLLGSYPATLHTELAEKGLMPKLGVYTMVESSLHFFRGQVDPDQV